MSKDKTIARIIYNPDGLIRAEYLPGIVNFTYWLAKQIDSGRWRQTGEGIWLGCEVSPEEAEYIRRLAIAQKDEDETACEIIGRPVPVDREKFVESRKLVEQHERVFNGKVVDAELKCIVDDTPKNVIKINDIVIGKTKIVTEKAKTVDEEYGQLSLFG